VFYYVFDREELTFRNHNYYLKELISCHFDSARFDAMHNVGINALQ